MQKYNKYNSHSITVYKEYTLYVGINGIVLSFDTLEK